MVNFSIVKKFDKLSMAKKSEFIEDKISIISTMRKNLASDIVAGYHMNNVVRQMVEIEDLEETINYIKSSYFTWRN